MPLVHGYLELACGAQRICACHQQVEVSKPDHLERLERPTDPVGDAPEAGVLPQWDEPAILVDVL